MTFKIHINFFYNNKTRYWNSTLCVHVVCFSVTNNAIAKWLEGWFQSYETRNDLKQLQPEIAKLARNLHQMIASFNRQHCILWNTFVTFSLEENCKHFPCVISLRIAWFCLMCCFFAFGYVNPTIYSRFVYIHNEIRVNTRQIIFTRAHPKYHIKMLMTSTHEL